MASEQTEDLKKSQQRQGGPGHRGPAGMMPGEKAKNFGKTMQQLLRYLKNYRWKLIVVFVFAVASTIFAIVTPKILGNMTNSIVDDYISIKTYDEITKRLPEGTTFPEGTTLKTLSDQQPSIAKQLESVPKDQQEKVLSIDLSEKPVMHFEVLGQTALWLIVLYLLSAIFGYIQGWIVSGVTKEVTFGFRRDIVKKINRLPLRYFDNRSYGDVLSRITNDVDTISQSLGQSLSQMITSVTMIVGIIVMMLSISLEMTGIAVIVVPVSMVFIALIVGRTKKY
jgi:ATP-binding cassette subfamily B protein